MEDQIAQGDFKPETTTVKDDAGTAAKTQPKGGRAAALRNFNEDELTPRQQTGWVVQIRKKYM